MQYTPEEIVNGLKELSPLSAMELRAICAEQKVAKLEEELKVTNHLLDEALAEDIEHNAKEAEKWDGVHSPDDVSSLPTLVPDDIS